MRFPTLTTPRLLLLLIILSGALLRFWNLGEMSLHNDELSAINSLNFESFGQLFLKKLSHSTHPIGHNTFVYAWGILFGTSPFIIRLPYAVIGLMSIPLLYLIGKDWFHPLTGLLAAATLAFLPFLLRFTHLARPYAPALFFSLGAIYCWSRLLFHQHYRLRYYGGFVIGALGALYFHHFSGLLVFLVGVTGLFYVRRVQLKYYLGAGVVIVLLYLPQLYFTELRLQESGGLAWLAPPQPLFLVDFIAFAFHHSTLLQSTILLLLVAPLLYYRKSIRWTKFHTFCLLWFGVSFLIGYIYSIEVAPILHRRGLFFVFPFLLLFGFSFYQPLSRPLSWVSFPTLLVAGYSLLCIYSLIFEKQYYSHQKSGFKTIAQQITEWDNQLRATPNTKVANVYNPFYINYYMSRYGEPVEFVLSRCQSSREIAQLKETLHQNAASHIIYAWETIDKPQVTTLILQHYPVIMGQVYPTDRSGTLLFSRFDDSGKPLYDTTYTLQKLSTNRHCSFLGPKQSFSCTFNKTVNMLPFEGGNEMQAGGKIRIQSGHSPIYLVLSITSPNYSNSYFYRKLKVTRFIDAEDGWQEIYWSQPLPEFQSPQDQVSAYFWSPNGRKAQIGNFTVRFLRGTH